MLKLFNTMKRKKELFVPSDEKKVNMYFCGPTVYDYAHIGNFRSYIFSDILRRYLEFLGFSVQLVMNITDVDDKTLRNSMKTGKPLVEFTERYVQSFFEDLEALRIKPASSYPRATENISGMIKIIDTLVKKGHAYVQKDGVYFDISSFPLYGKLSKLDAKKLKSTGRVRNDEYEKEEARDFVLWKAWSEEDGNVHWDAEIAGQKIRGRPGWHVECSVMSAALGTIDIHGGGVDLMFPHHENEISQSFCASAPMPRYWVHCEHLLVDERKMSKRYKNFYTLRDLQEYDPLAIRYVLLAGHYRNQLNFTFESLKAAKKAVDNINEFIVRVKDEIDTIEAPYNKELELLADESYESFVKAMDDDLNVPNALKAVFRLMHETNKRMDDETADAATLACILKLMEKFDTVLNIIRHNKELTDEEAALLDEREELRKKKKFEEADEVREKLRKRGVILEDTPPGARWHKT